MPLCEIRSIQSRGLSRVRAFQAHDVALTYSWRSWSGVRRQDGGVVFALPERDVHADDGGCRCLLWWRDGVESWLGHESSEERLSHCRLAASQGSAEGFLVRADSVVAASEMLGLRVQKVADQYWALWGWAARVDHTNAFTPRVHFAACHAG